MTEQPAALRLADALDKSVLAVNAEAAAELRRLHKFCMEWEAIHEAEFERITTLEAALRQAVEALENAERYGAGDWGQLTTTLRERLARDAALDRLYEVDRELGLWPEPARQEQEPVAWMLGDEVYRAKQCRLFSKNPGEEIPGQIPLYTAPQPAQQPIVPKGYALIGIDALKAWGVYEQVVDACRYGITGEQK